MCAQGLGRQAPGRLTHCNYGNRNKKAEATGSAETMCRVGGHLARAGHPRQAQEATAAPNASSAARAPMCRACGKAITAAIPKYKAPPRPTACTCSHHTAARQFQHTEPWSGRAEQNDPVMERATPQASTISEPVSGARGPIARGPIETQSQVGTPHLSHSNTSGDFCVQHFTNGR